MDRSTSPMAMLTVVWPSFRLTESFWPIGAAKGISRVSSTHPMGLRWTARDGFMLRTGATHAFKFSSPMGHFFTSGKALNWDDHGRFDQVLKVIFTSLMAGI